MALRTCPRVRFPTKSSVKNSAGGVFDPDEISRSRDSTGRSTIAVPVFGVEKLMHLDGNRPSQLGVCLPISG